MEIVSVCLILCLGLVSLAGGYSNNAKKQEMLELLNQIKSFMAYIDKHKDELPLGIRERYGELENFVKSKQ